VTVERRAWALQTSLACVPAPWSQTSPTWRSAQRAKRVRMQQCREGWHLDTEPEWTEPDTPDDDGEGDEDESPRRVRSTRRRQDAPDLPRVPAEDRTIGRVFTAPDGKTYRSSMFVTPDEGAGQLHQASPRLPMRRSKGSPPSRPSCRRVVAPMAAAAN
jgi:hypothetical protein